MYDLWGNRLRDVKQLGKHATIVFYFLHFLLKSCEHEIFCDFFVFVYLTFGGFLHHYCLQIPIDQTWLAGAFFEKKQAFTVCCDLNTQVFATMCILVQCTQDLSIH